MSARGTIIDTSVPDPDYDPALGEDIPGDPPANEPAPSAEEETEARARAMGWHPLNEYRGDPKRWTSAAEFIKRGEDNLPILRDQNRRMAEKITKLDGVVGNLSKTMSEQKAAIDDLVKLARNANQQGYERRQRELEAERREAATSGDAAAVDQISERIEKLKEARDTAAAPAAPPQPTPPAPDRPPAAPEVAAFYADNPWMTDNPFLGQQMVNEHTIIMRSHPRMPLADQLDMALDALKDRFPEEFGMTRTPPATPPVPPRPRVPPVATPTPPRPQRPGADPFDAIADTTERADAKAAFARIKRHQPDITAAEYMQLYGDPKADVLELQRHAKKNRRA